MINELVQDNRTNGNSNSVDTGEFIELYNAGMTIANIGGWAVSLKSLDSGGEVLSIPIPAGTMLAPGDYYVIGNSNGISPSLIDLDTFTNNLFPNDNNVYELRDQTAALVDALGVQLAFDPQYDFATAEQLAQIGGGGWSQLLTTVETPQSYGRYIDGDDTNRNGRDFGVIPSTPGTSNSLPEIGAYVLPDVDALALAPGNTVPGFSYSFVGPKVVDPTATGTYIKHALPSPSPQGGNAIVAWDQTGGGNMVASDSLVTSFDIWAYIDTINTGVTGGGTLNVESTTYGIGTTDGLFGIPDPTGELSTAARTFNGNTGVGWVFIKDDAASFKKLFLIDFNDGGDSRPDGEDWTVLATIDLTAIASDWYRLSVDYDPASGEVVARFDDQVFTHTITTDMVGTFYIGFREPGGSGVSNNAAPPIFDVIVGLPGDYNNDGSVNAADYTVYRNRKSGIGGTMLPNDAGAAGVTIDDYNYWKAHYGESFGSGASNLDHTADVPEPAAMLLFCCGGLAAAAFRRRDPRFRRNRSRMTIGRRKAFDFPSVRQDATMHPWEMPALVTSRENFITG